VAVAGALHHRAAEACVSSVISQSGGAPRATASSPIAAARCVEATMSVNNTVRRARCDCAGAAWLPVGLLDPGRDPIGIGHPGRVVRAVDLSNRAPGMWAAVGRPAPERVLAGMDDQGRRGDRRRGLAHVDPERGFGVARAIPGSRSCAPTFRAAVSTG
jgi:hypothetical protein